MKIIEISCKNIFLDSKIEELEKIPKIPFAATIGTFDGLHGGHIYFLNNFWKYALRHKLATVIFTFHQNPIFKQKEQVLTTIHEKINYFQEHDLNYLIILKIDSWLYKTSSIQFINFIKKYFSIKIFFCTEKTTYGKNKTGSIQELENHFKINPLSLVKIDGLNISSSLIKKKFQALAPIDEINRYLVHPYFIIGKIIEGVKLASKFNLGTVNINFPNFKAIPADGVYVGLVYFKTIEKYFWAIVYVGKSPTLLNLSTSRIEAHIFFNFKVKTNKIKDLEFIHFIKKNKYLTIYFLKFLRSDKKFSTSEELLEQIKNDIKTTKRHLNHLIKKFSLSSPLLNYEVEKKVIENLFINSQKYI